MSVTNKEDNVMDEQDMSQQIASERSVEKGHTNLLIGAGFGIYGAVIGMSVGFICPACLIATPLFLGMGGVQRYKYLKNKARK